MEVRGQFHAPIALPTGKKNPGTHWMGDGVSPKTGQDAVVKRKIPCPSRDWNTDRPTRSLVAIPTDLASGAIPPLSQYEFNGVVFG